MFKALAEWLEARTGYRGIVREALDEPIPGGARWRYVFGSCLTASFVIQLVTGVLLMTAYSPSSTTAWGSVYYITRVVDFGWFIRGLHHFGAQAMIILLAVHLFQVVIAGAYRTPRELNWWFGLGLMFLTLALGLTGYLLPWDQKGYWATKVATNIMGNAPLIGPTVQKLVVGGNEYGNQTLTRFYALHVAILPGLLVLLLIVHVALFRKHGVTHPANTRGRLDRFWPKQVFLDTLAIGLVFAVVVGLTVYEQFWRHGIPLDAPADPASSNYPARPEWYFLSLFQLLNQLPRWLSRWQVSSSQIEILGTIVIPGTVVLLLALLPFFDKVFPRRLAHFLAVAVVFSLAGGAGFLTVQAMQADAADPQFRLASQQAAEAASRALVLAEVEGIAPAGAGYLLANDPKTRGYAVLAQQCLGCHYYAAQGQVTEVRWTLSGDEMAASASAPEIEGAPEPVARAVHVKIPGFQPEGAARPDPLTPGRLRIDGTNASGEKVIVHAAGDGSELEVETRSKQSASDLAHFGSGSWLRGLLENPSDPRYFGTVASAGGMQRWKRNSKLTPIDLNQITDFFERHVSRIPEDLPSSEWIEREDIQRHPGFKHFQEGGECAQCHVDWVFPNEEAPNLYGWGSPWWIRRMILRPGAPHLYGFLSEEERMPAFEGRLTENDLRAIVRLLRDDFVGSAPPSTPGGSPRPIDPR